MRFIARRLDRFGSLAKRSVRCPARPDDATRPDPGQRDGGGLHQAGVSVGELGRRGIVVACALIPQGAVDHHKIGRRAARCDLPCRGQADQEIASAGEQLLGHQDSEGRPNHAANDADAPPAKLERVEVRMIAGPSRKRFRHPGLAQPARQIAIRIKNADRRRGHVGQSLLPPRFAQQRRRGEERFRRRALVVEDGRSSHLGYLPIDAASTRRSVSVWV